MSSRVRATLGIVLGTIMLVAAVPTLLAASLTMPEEARFLDGDATLTVTSIALDAPGYVVVHEGSATRPGAVLGASALMASGRHYEIDIPLGRAIREGEVLWPMLYNENNLNSTFDAGIDQPIVDTVRGNGTLDGLISYPVRMTRELLVDLDVASLEPEPGDQVVTIPAVTLDAAGYVVLYAGNASTFASAPLGASAHLEAGAHTDVSVPLNRALEGSEYLWAVLHAEGNGTTTFDGTSADRPLTHAERGVAALSGMMAARLQVAAPATPGAFPVSGTGLSEASAPAGTSVVLMSSLTLLADGYVIVRAGPDIVGTTPRLPAGTYRNLLVELDAALDADERLLLLVATEFGDADDSGADLAVDADVEPGGANAVPMPPSETEGETGGETEGADAGTVGTGVVQAPRPADTGNAGLWSGDEPDSRAWVLVMLIVAATAAGVAGARALTAR